MAHKRDDVALIVDVTGECSKCHHHCTGHLVAYYDGEILIRCNHCKKAGGFKPDDETYTDAKKFIPFINDEDSGGQ